MNSIKLHRKILLITFLMFSIFSNITFNAKAYYLVNNYTSFTNGESYTLELKATPEDRENGVKISIISTGIRITDFEIYNAKDFVIVNPDCTNGEYFTDNRVCATLVKDSELTLNESLGFLTFKVLDSDKFSIVKANGSFYSNGEDLREDLDSLEDKIVKEDEKDIVTIGGFNIDTNDDVLIFSSIGLIISISFFIISMTLILFRRKRNPI